MFDAIGLSPEGFVIAVLMTFSAAFVRGVTGFGMAIILVPLLGLVIAPEQAVVGAILLQLLIGPVGLRRVIADSEKESVLPISLTAVATTPLGLLALTMIPADQARLLIAVIAIGAFVLVTLPASASARAPSRIATLLTGSAAGLLAGFAGMPGPPVVPYYMRRNLPPRSSRASMILVFFATAIMGSLVAALRGLATPSLLALSAALFLPMLAGNWLGGQLFGRVPVRLWRAGVGLVLGIAAASALFRLLA
ncbi:sulfite exporter TauE/SafE family protein [Sphingosinicella sp.]|uniref:sulfite exporter TauE/SafE family protein n=1 Tax=Sphingosinicella sp. TaxID=1917971 RepID=UPI00179010C3|nr:sulfite exporter TauE/SafE family protein [Sphingosinicella sp.]MBA4759693.1 sulfite exporter TauE/SafE family protein [Sphingosinicella sp.]